MVNRIKKIKIIFTGGGTSGSVTPLLAVADELDRQYFEFLWIGTRSGPEQKMAAAADVNFKSITAVKLHRYLSGRTIIHTLLAPVLLTVAFMQSFYLLLKFRPTWVITAGSFVSVPVVWSAFFLRKKILVHQQDIRAGLANKMMAPCANIITVAFEKSLKDYGRKAVWIGSPVRVKIIKKVIETKPELVKNNFPTIFIFGGGTGALALNNLVKASLAELVKFCHVVHVVGCGKASQANKKHSRYEQYEFLPFESMVKFYRQADLVVSRAGMSTISELAYFGKPAIIIPMPETHQVDNAQFLQRVKAAYILDQNRINKEVFITAIKANLYNNKLRDQYCRQIKKILPQGAEFKMVDIIKNGGI